MNKSAAAVLCLLLPWLILSGGTVSAERLMRISVENTDAHVQTIAVRNFAEQLQEKLRDELEIRFYSSASLFRNTEAIQAISMGKLEMAVPGTWQLGSLVPEISIFHLPSFYGVPPEQVYSFLESRTGKDLVNHIEENLFVKVPGSWMDLGYTHLFSADEPIAAYADITGMRIRVAGGYGNEARIAAMGGIPMTIDWSDVPLSLQQGIFEGLLTSYESIRSIELWDYGVRYAFEDRQYFAQYVPIISQRFWNSLSPETQKIIRETWEEAAAEQRKQAAEAQEEARRECMEHGIMIARPDGEAAAAMKRRLEEEQHKIAEMLGIPKSLVISLEEYMRSP